MPKQKTHKGLAKRVKITAKGKVKRRKSFKGHLLSSRNGKKIRQLRRTDLMPEAEPALDNSGPGGYLWCRAGVVSLGCEKLECCADQAFPRTFGISLPFAWNRAIAEVSHYSQGYSGNLGLPRRSREDRQKMVCYSPIGLLTNHLPRRAR